MKHPEPQHHTPTKGGHTMKDIIKIEIKGSSGYVPAEYAYHDHLTLTPESIAYEQDPFLKDEGAKGVWWNYSTNDTAFAEQFGVISDMIPAELSREPEYAITDIGTTEFIITYSDGSEERHVYTVFHDFFEELFTEIKILVPESEPIPEVLSTPSDEEEIDYQL